MSDVHDFLLNPINLSYLVLEFTISSGKLFHLLIVLIQKRFITSEPDAPISILSRMLTVLN